MTFQSFQSAWGALVLKEEKVEKIDWVKKMEDMKNFFEKKILSLEKNLEEKKIQESIEKISGEKNSVEKNFQEKNSVEKISEKKVEKNSVEKILVIGLSVTSFFLLLWAISSTLHASKLARLHSQLVEKLILNLTR